MQKVPQISELTGSNHRCRAQFKCAQTVMGQRSAGNGPNGLSYDYYYYYILVYTTTTTTTTTTCGRNKQRKAVRQPTGYQDSLPKTSTQKHRTHDPTPQIPCPTPRGICSPVLVTTYTQRHRQNGKSTKKNYKNDSRDLKPQLPTTAQGLETHQPRTKEASRATY